ncbi:MAG: HAMP domain-containing sensor histidine kinase [Bryobacteraceae bacterium]
MPESGQDELDRLRRESANARLFARMIAHDLNNVLGGMLGHASLLEALTEPGGELHESSMVISQAATRATALVRQLLDYSGEPTARFEPVDLAAATQEVAGLIRGTEAPRVETVFEASPAWVTGDPAQLYQMVLNLTVNAREALRGQADPRLLLRVRRIAAAETPAGIELTVADNGPGIPPELRDRIFDPFVSGNPTGRGLGLAIVKRVVETHGGAIGLATNAGGGTAFRVRLPERGRA